MAVLEVVLPVDQPSTPEVAGVCLRCLRDEPGMAALRLNGSRVKEVELVRKLQGKEHFELEIGGRRFEWARLGSEEMALLRAEGLQSGIAEALVHSLASIAPLVIARLYDPEYEFWQNAEDPLEYEDLGRSTEGLPMRRRDLPPPLDDLIVDTSRNPGRRLVRHGYVEAVGHRIWLGPEFFVRVPGASRERVRAATWLKVSEVAPGLLDVTARDAPFSDETTKEAQDQLRAVLFGEFPS